MIYYATVHWKSTRWIDIQLAMISRYTQAPYKVYACLNVIDPAERNKFSIVLDTDEKDHAVKLDLLAERIVEDATDSDWIVFLDGDAFPLKPVHETVQKHLEKYPLVAVQRRENLGEKQPHPCFCATTVGFWKEIKGTWAIGHQWINAMGYPDTDVGGDLLGILERRGIEWLPLHRTNRINRHPVFFGIYADLVYHHGSGFRRGASRQGYFEAGLYTVYKRIDARILNNIVPRKYLKKMRDSMIHPEGRRKRRIYRALAPIDREIFEMIRRDPESVREFAGLPE